MNSQIQFETNGLRVLVVRVPEDTVSVEVYDKESLPCALIVFTPHEYFEPGMPSPIPIPEGSWKYHCDTDTMTEEQAKLLTVEMKDSGYPFEIQDRVDTLEDILRPHGVNPNEKHVILIGVEY